jgi:uncharacterized protein YdaU (DUF1376 family)
MLFFGRDFYEDEAVRLMSLEQEAIYMRLLWHAWREGSIPASVEGLAAIVNVPLRRFAKLWPGVAVKWHQTEDGSRLINRRQERERLQRAETKQRQSEGGRIGNAKRWGDRSPTDTAPNRSPIASEAKAKAKGETRGDGGMDGGSRTPSQNQNSEGVSTPVPRTGPQTAGDIGAGVLRAVAP